MALGFMRRHRRWLYVFLWLVILTFVLLYIPMEDMAGTTSAGTTVAEVGDRTISLAEYQRAYNQQRAYLQQLYQGQVDDETLRRMGLEEQALQSLIDERVLAQEAERLGLTADDESVRRRLGNDPRFQRDGRFVGAAEVRQILRRAGIKESQLEDELRADVLRQKLAALVTDGVTVTDAEAETEYRRRNEQVKVEYVLAVADPATVAVTDAEARAHFDGAQDAYRYPERRVLSYVLLDPAAVQARIAITEMDREAYYRANSDQFRQEEEVCASHVLVKVVSPDQADAHPEEAAQAIAAKVLADLRGGADFAAVARRASEDQGSAASGGDLGCFGRGRMVPEFENAAFQLQPGQTSDLVRSPYGFHVIRVTSRREAAATPYEQVKPRIEQTLGAERTRDMLRQASEAMTEALRRGRGLEVAASEQGLTVQKSQPLGRAEVVPPLASAALVARGFEMAKGQVEPQPFPLMGGYVFIRVDEIEAPRMPSFDEVKDTVRADLARRRAFERARGLAADVRARAAASGLEGAAAAYGLARKQTDTLVSHGQGIGDLGAGGAAEEAAFALAPNELSEPVRTPRGYAILRVIEKKAADPAAFAAQKVELTSSLEQQRKEQLFRAYLQQARKRFTIATRPDALRRVAG